MRAAVDGHKSACKRLLGMGADARATDAEGRTALDLALAYKHAALADYLRVRGGVPLGEEIERAGRGGRSRRDAFDTGRLSRRRGVGEGAAGRRTRRRRRAPRRRSFSRAESETRGRRALSWE